MRRGEEHDRLLDFTTPSDDDADAIESHGDARLVVQLAPDFQALAQISERVVDPIFLARDHGEALLHSRDAPAVALPLEEVQRLLEAFLCLRDVALGETQLSERVCEMRDT